MFMFMGIYVPQNACENQKTGAFLSSQSNVGSLTCQVSTLALYILLIQNTKYIWPCPEATNNSTKMTTLEYLWLYPLSNVNVFRVLLGMRALMLLVLHDEFIFLPG